MPEKISALCTRLIDDDVWIGALVEAGPAPDDVSTFVVYGKWEGAKTSLHNSGYSVNGRQCAWCGKGETEPTFVIFGRAIVGVQALTGTVRRFPDPDLESASTACLSVDVTYDPSVKQDVFAAVFGDGSLHVLPNQEGGTWSKHTQTDLKLTEVCLTSDPLNAVHILALGGGMLHHGFVTLQKTEHLPPLAPIKSGVRDLAASETMGENLTVFAPAYDNAALVFYLMFETASSNWNIQNLTLPSADNVQPYQSYTTEITAYDALGVVMPLTPVWIWAKESTRVEVNGGVCFIGPRNRVNLHTNSRGQISIAQETGLLAVPEIFVAFEPLAGKTNGLPGAEEATLVVNQYAPVQARLSKITPDELKQAVKADGTPLLEEKFRTKETTDALSQALHQCMGLISNDKTIFVEASRTQGASAGCFWSKPDDLAKVGRVTAHTNATSWCLEKKGNALCYRSLTTAEAEHLLADAHNCMYGVNGIGSFFRRLGDLIRAAAEKAIEIVKVVVTTVGNIVKTVITYVKDTIEMLFESVIHTAQMVFDVVESIFNEVRVFFEDIFKWLAYIFKWDDILRTKDILAYFILEQVKFAEGIVDYAGQKVDEAMLKALDQTKTAFETLIQKLDPAMSVGSAMNGTGFGVPQNPAVEESTSNNFILSQYLDRDMAHAVGNKVADQCPNLMLEPGVFDEFQKILTDLVQTVSDCPAFSQAAEYFSKMLSDRDNMFRMMLCGLLKILEGLATVVLATARSAAKALFALVKSLFKAIYTLLNTEIKIPFLSSLYTYISGGPKLTLLEIPALIMALPATILHKIITGKAPFPDANSMQEFKNTFNAQNLIEHIIPVKNGCKANTAFTAVPKGLQITLMVFAMVGSGTYYMCSLSGDFIIASSTGVPLVPMSLTISTICTEALWFAVTAPWYTLATPSWAEIVNWSVSGSGTLYDIVVTVWQKAIPEHSGNDLFTVGTVIYGVVFLTSGILSLCYASEEVSGVDPILNVCPPVICISKIGLTKPMSALTEGLSPFVVVCLGLVGGFIVPLSTPYNV